METVSGKLFQEDPQRYLHQVNQDVAPLLIAGHKSEPATVLMSRQTYDGILATMDILSQPGLVAKIRRGQQIVSKNVKQHGLLDDDGYPD